eukprot:597501-Hanusia_phi.AAC.1
MKLSSMEVGEGEEEGARRLLERLLKTAVEQRLSRNASCTKKLEEYYEDQEDAVFFTSWDARRDEVWFMDSEPAFVADQNDPNLWMSVRRRKGLDMIDEDVDSSQEEDRKEYLLVTSEGENARRQREIRNCNITLKKILNSLYSHCQKRGPKKLILGIGIIAKHVGADLVVKHPILELEVCCKMEDGKFNLRPSDGKVMVWDVSDFDTSDRGDADGGDGETPPLQHRIEDLLEQYKKVDSSLHPAVLTNFTQDFCNLLLQIGQLLDGNFAELSEPPNTLLEIEPSDTARIFKAWAVYEPPVKIGRQAAQDSAKLRRCIESKDTVLPNFFKTLVLDRGSQSSSGGNSRNRAKVELSAYDYLLPLKHNQAQLEIIRKLKERDVVVVQGPPGTGKTHTIGKCNHGAIALALSHADQTSLLCSFASHPSLLPFTTLLLSHALTSLTANVTCCFVANGKRVLITSSSTSALEVMKDQISKGCSWLGKLAISWHGTKLDALKQLAEAANSLENLNQSDDDEDKKLEDHYVKNLKKAHQSMLKEDARIKEMLAVVLTNLKDLPAYLDTICHISKIKPEKLKSSLNFLIDICKLTDDLEDYVSRNSQDLSHQLEQELQEAKQYFRLEDVSELEVTEGFISLIKSNECEERIRGLLRTNDESQKTPKKKSIFSRMFEAVGSILPGQTMSKEYKVLEECGLKRWLENSRFDETSPFDFDAFAENLARIVSAQCMHELHKLCPEISYADKHIKNRMMHENTICENSKKIVELRAKQLVRSNCTAAANRDFESLRRIFKTFAEHDPKVKKGGKLPNSYNRQKRELDDIWERGSLLKLLPIWIIPTEKVSELLPSEIGCFDLVMIEEASQSDALSLPVIFRGKQVCIIGDDEQVSPTESKNDAVEKLLEKNLVGIPRSTIENLMPGKSIFDLFQEVYADCRVKLYEHFRCLPDLIQFSNHEFYGGKLIPLRREASPCTIKSVFVNEDSDRESSTYRGKKENRKEADEIVKTDMRAATKTSIGVISLWGNKQSNQIQKRLRTEPLISSQQFEDHEIKCGDAREFQGSERDVIMLSMVAQGKCRAICDPDYRKAFNVAASRARKG